MLQAIVKKGKVVGREVPAPVVSDNGLLIKVVNSCISAGTEMSGVSSSGTPLIKKAMEQPDKVVKIFNMAKKIGVANTYAKIKGILETGSPTGYSISGVVIGIGAGLTGFEVGEAVAAAGAGLANHAEFVDVPQNLVMKMPIGMDFVDASTVTLGGIAMQGVRRADLRFGEFAVVLGAGILGLLSVQMLRLSGARVIAIDLDPRRIEIARELGAEFVIDPNGCDPVKEIENITGSHGADAVLFTAATGSSGPLSQAFKMCKRKGRVVLVGVSGMQIERSDIYPKELDFLISTSYGPGRYDPQYEEKGLDYPYAYVRWTENRNMSEYLRLVHEKQIRLERIVERIYPIARVGEAFEELKTVENKPLMVILDYGLPVPSKFASLREHDRRIVVGSKVRKKDCLGVGLIGAGSFATGMHLPNMEKLNDKFKLHAVVDKIGHKAKQIAQSYNARISSTRVEDVLNDDEIDLVFITTRHDTHAPYVLQALNAGKHVFVEKPLATTKEDLDRIADFFLERKDSEHPLLMVGFNRRFSRYAQEIKKQTKNRNNPLYIHYRMNAGYIPMDHWIHEDGGRIIGEGCHIIDLITFLTGSVIKSISYESLTPANGKFSPIDNRAIVLKYEDGSLGTLEYFAVGSKEFPKEYMEVHFDEKTIVLDDYRSLKGYGLKVAEITTPASEKGQYEEILALYDAIKGKSPWPIPLGEMIGTTAATLMIV